MSDQVESNINPHARMHRDAKRAHTNILKRSAEYTDIQIDLPTDILVAHKPRKRA
jgi:hypothetical protein